MTLNKDLLETSSMFDFLTMTGEEKQFYVDNLNSRFPDNHWEIQNGLPVECRTQQHIDDGTLPEIEF